MKRYITVVGALLLTACDSSSHVVQPAKEEALSGVAFGVVPGTVSLCDSNVAVKISWDATGADFDAVKVFVGPEGARKLFAAWSAKGSADTGPWVSAGTEFVLTNADENQQLARFVVGSESCD